MIASSKEIKDLVFTRNFDIAKIKDIVINLVELEQVKPLLGDALFLKVKTLPGDYCDLLELLKPMIAYYLKYYITKSNHVKTGNKGEQVAQGSNETQSNAENGKRDSLTYAKKYRKQVLTYLKDNSLCTPQENEGIFNGIIIL